MFLFLTLAATFTAYGKKVAVESIGTISVNSSSDSGTIYKTLIFVRHGQSGGNVALETGDAPPRDAPLTELGIRQAKEAASILSARLVAGNALTNYGAQGWLLASSPLTRALETAEWVWPSGFTIGRRAIAAELREFQVDRDDLGSPRTKLEQEWPSLASAFALSNLPEVWWSTTEGTSPDEVVAGVDGLIRVDGGKPNTTDQSLVDARIIAAIDWLYKQPESKIVIVAHAGFFSFLLKRLGLGDWYLPNCGVFFANNVALSPQ